MTIRKSMLALLAVILTCTGFSLPAAAQAPSAAAALAQLGQEDKFVFVFFWRQKNAASDAMAQSLQNELATYGDRVASLHVQVTDPAQREIVDHFGVSRAPMPLVVAVAPNGAVTRAIQSRLTAEVVAEAIVSPALADCMKAMQDGKTVVLLVNPQGDEPTPLGAAEFLSDADFRDRSALVRVASQDPAEGEFLQHLGLTTQEENGCVVMLAPPGVLVGKFAVDVSFADMASELHAAGKCCDDENCRHNR